MTDFFITPCDPTDLPAVVDLVNSAYRGEGAQAGWTTEADYIDGQRTSLDDLSRDMEGATLLVLRQAPAGEILACALVEPHLDEGYAYIGMVTVKPGLQAGGVGRAMLQAAEDHAASLGAARAQMTVVHLRDSLIAWYQRRGYALTGATRPFPYGDDRFGKPLRDDLAFMVLERAL